MPPPPPLAARQAETVGLMLRITIIACGALIVNNPYLIAALFAQALLIVTCMIGIVRKFLAFVLFIVYMGGIIILISYCVMLLPTIKFSSPLLFVFPALALLSTTPFPRSYSLGLLLSPSLIFFIAIFLFIVMLVVVAIIDYSAGSIKLYVRVVSFVVTLVVALDFILVYMRFLPFILGSVGIIMLT